MLRSTWRKELFTAWCGLLLSLTAALGCSCDTVQPTACSIFNERTAVLVGRVLADEGGGRIRVGIEEALHNVPAGARQIVFDNGGICPFSLRPGERYIFAAHVAAPGLYAIGACSPYFPLPGSEQMLAKLHHQEESQALLAGNVSARIRGREGLIDGAVVTALGNGIRRSLATDFRGHYEFAGLPRGSYRIKVARAGFALDSESGAGLTGGTIFTGRGGIWMAPDPDLTVTVDRNSCVEVNFLLRRAN